MRATLDIDADILQAAKELAEAEGRSVGQVLSDLARKALTHDFTEPMTPAEDGDISLVLKEGFYALPKRGGFVTNELVRRLQEELEEEEVRQKGGC
ncbi:MAG TPA: CopG family transcriptional regulator [Hyphomicrobiaceae bacterium]|jgi:hypothetical protein